MKSSMDVTVASINNPKSNSVRLAKKNRESRFKMFLIFSIFHVFKILVNEVPFAVSKSRKVSNGDNRFADGKAEIPERFFILINSFLF